MPARRIAFQGEPGANSHMACLEYSGELTPHPCATFEDVFAAVSSGEAGYCMIPIENSLYGRITDIHHLLPESGLYIRAEHFLAVHHQLMAAPGASLATIKSVMSQPPALGQCRRIIRELGLTMVVGADTAGSARIIAERRDPALAALASTLAAELHGLTILRSDVEDEAHNTTRFLVMAKEPDDADPSAEPVMTTFVFRVRNVPAALYKALGGFATNGVNMTKLESYQLGGSFSATQFYADIEGHPSSRNVRLALEELQFFCSHMKVLGVYPAHPFRRQAQAAMPANLSAS
ncbi:MAG TPA: prephenate dehydratase [Alphaproteobacteria bacterium]|nr:prephenate dehydratase [Alphaproteobacteria bacterium]HAJ45150.1 prephenate dehydratase [Alphaproteobacteria bacterium]